MGFIDDMFQDHFDRMAFYGDDEDYSEYDDSFLLEREQRPSHSGGVDWRYEKGGVFYDD